jgi:hypothetical protein
MGSIPYWSGVLTQIIATMGSQAVFSISVEQPCLLHRAMYVEISDNPQKSNTPSVGGYCFPSAIWKWMNWTMCYNTSTLVMK